MKETINESVHLAFYNLSQSYNDIVTFKNLSLEITKGETVFLIGESGCGKTTLLKTLCQLIPQSSGKIELSGEDVSLMNAQAYKKRFGYVIQKAGLLPHLTIAQNVALPAQIHNLTENIECRTKQLFESLNLDFEELKSRFPHQISGGQKQRVSIARALINDPEILFMDEPFGALDPITKKSIYKDFLNIKSLSDKTVIIVSHDIKEACILSDRICILKDGQFEQIGTYNEMKTNPKTEYVKNYMSDWV